jgi:biotin carboxyl carrier protein
MQNELRATSAGRVAKITVQEGATVETGGTLMILVVPEVN